MINELEFKVKLNKLLKNKSFTEIFDDADSQFYLDFSDFVYSKIGQIWLKKINGKKYLEWQND